MNWHKILWSLWFGVIISSTSYTMLLPFLPLYLGDLGADHQMIKLWSGAVFAVTFLVSAVMSPLWGRLADKAGKRRMLIRAGLSLSFVYFLGSLVRSPLELFFMRMLQGFATGFVPAALSIVASTAPEDKLGFSLGIMQTATLTGTILGPLFGGGLAHLFGIRASFSVASVCILAGTAAVWLLVPEPERRPASTQTGSIVSDLQAAFADPLMKNVLGLVVITQIGIMMLQPLLALHVADLQGGGEGVVLTSGVIFSASGIAGAIAAPLWGRMGQRAGFRKILAIGFAGSGFFSLFPYFTANIWLFGLLQFAFGFFIAAVYPALNTLMAMHTDASFRGRAFGLMMSANQVGSLIGPLLGTIASVWLGIRVIFVCVGLFLLTTGLIIWRGRQRPAVMSCHKS
ncbi:MAG: MFS transporter [Sporomusaceae bacterium]|nr:MFS transporter [Sporomusaceae bacterium]